MNKEYITRGGREGLRLHNIGPGTYYIKVKEVSL